MLLASGLIIFYAIPSLMNRVPHTLVFILLTGKFCRRRERLTRFLSSIRNQYTYGRFSWTVVVCTLLSAQNDAVTTFVSLDCSKYSLQPPKVHAEQAALMLTIN